jgi:hypothetical protein
VVRAFFAAGGRLPIAAGGLVVSTKMLNGDEPAADRLAVVGRRDPECTAEPDKSDTCDNVG